MAARVTVAEVKLIMDNCSLDDSIVDAYILAANALVTSILGTDTSIGTVLLKEVERWYTAHLIACTTWRTTTKEKIGEASVEYTGQFRENLSSTPYGQTVLQLDITGKMGLIGKKAVSTKAVTSFE